MKNNNTKNQKATKSTALAERFKNAKDYGKQAGLQPVTDTHKRFQSLQLAGVEGNDFAQLQTILAGINNVTMTAKNIRVKHNKIEFIYIWRRASGVRVYTNAPALFKGIDWQEYTNQNEPYTHVANTTAQAVVNALIASEN